MCLYGEQEIMLSDADAKLGSPCYRLLCTYTVMDGTVWQVKWLFTPNTGPLPLCRPVTFGSRQQPATPRLWTDKTGQQLMRACVRMFHCEWVCIFVCVKIHKSSCSPCGRSSNGFEMKRSAALQIKVAWNTTLVAAQPEKGKDKQNMGATRITSGMSFKQGMVFDNQQRGCRIACLCPHFGLCLWQWLLNFLQKRWNLKWRAVCWSTIYFFLTVVLRLLFSLIIVWRIRLASLIFLIRTTIPPKRLNQHWNHPINKNCINSNCYRTLFLEFIPLSPSNKQSGVNTENID